VALWLRVVLALVVPVVWGLLSAWLYDRIAAWYKGRKSQPDQPREPQ
jgi:hypothetical protein